MTSFSANEDKQLLTYFAFKTNNSFHRDQKFFSLKPKMIFIKVEIISSRPLRCRLCGRAGCCWGCWRFPQGYRRVLKLHFSDSYNLSLLSSLGWWKCSKQILQISISLNLFCQHLQQVLKFLIQISKFPWIALVFTFLQSKWEHSLFSFGFMWLVRGQQKKKVPRTKCNGSHKTTRTYLVENFGRGQKVLQKGKSIPPEDRKQKWNSLRAKVVPQADFCLSGKGRPKRCWG